MPVSSNLTRNFDGDLTLGTDRWNRDTFTDLFTGHSPLLKMMEARGSLKVLTGGLGQEFIVEPLIFESGAGPQPTGVNDEFSELPMVPVQGLTSSLWTMAEYATILAIGEREYRQLGKSTQKLDLFQTKAEIVRKKFIQTLYGYMFAAENAVGAVGSRTTLASLRCLLNRGAGTANPADAYIDTTRQVGTAIGTGAPTLVGNIDRATNGNAFWSTPCESPGSPQAAALSQLNVGITAATRNSDVPTIGLLRPDVWNKFPPLLISTGYVNVFENSKVMEGFQTFRYRGVEFAFDPLMPKNAAGTAATTQMFLINPDYLTLYMTSKAPEFEMLGKDRTLTRQWQYLWFLQLIGRHLGNVHYRHDNIN